MSPILGAFQLVLDPYFDSDLGLFGLGFKPRFTSFGLLLDTIFRPLFGLLALFSLLVFWLMLHNFLGLVQLGLHQELEAPEIERDS